MTSEMQVPGLPAELRERVLLASLRARPSGQCYPEVASASPREAFCRVADSFYRMLCSLDDEQWHTPVLRDLDAQRLVGHLIGVEEDLQRALAGDQEVACADHVESTQRAADRQAGRPAAQTARDWRRCADRTLAMTESYGLGTVVRVHGIRLPLGELLIARTFEVWTHDNDIRAATGRPACAPDPATLRPMTDLAVDLWPVATSRAGLTEPVSVHLVLTGAGGGTWDVLLGRGAADAEPASTGLAPDEGTSVSIVTDAVGFCRLFANRAAPADLDLHVTGDAERATSVLAAGATLALD